VASLPLFPLSTVLMPGAPLPLHIFEPRYRQLTVDLVTGALPDKQFGVIAVREGWSAGATTDEIDGLHRVGCAAELLDARRLPDGRFDIVTRGVRRFRLLRVDADARPYLVGEVEYVPDRPADAPEELPLLAGAARAAHRRYCDTAWTSGEWSEPDADVEPAELPHLLAADCLLPLSDRQRLLEQTSPAVRLRMVRAFMIREAGLLRRLRAVPAPMHTFSVELSAN
jgi:Lon protease-like protein